MSFEFPMTRHFFQMVFITLFMQSRQISIAIMATLRKVKKKPKSFWKTATSKFFANFVSSQLGVLVQLSLDFDHLQFIVKWVVLEKTLVRCTTS